MNKTSFIFLANGFEEIEALTTVDVLRRAEMPVVMVSISDSLEVVGAHGIIVKADKLFDEVDYNDVEWLILPGGMPGASRLSEFLPLNELLVSHYSGGGKLAAICAAPSVVLSPLGLLDGKNATCYPSFEDHMGKAHLTSRPVVIDGKIITACGPSAAMQFSLAIVSMTKGDDEAYDIASGMLLYPQHHQFYF
ncbi:MAG: DJ-1/PfpI family protein [Muribaculaceae bacterium]|nr:DJ-1/PfpI family protein [Muribaculaceae bacterium]